MSTNYNFAKRFAPDVSGRLNKADDYLYMLGDPIAAVESTGTAMEQFVHHILVKEMFAEDTFTTLKDGIDCLERKGVCPRKIIQKLNFIRKIRNRASHRNQASRYEAKIAQKNAHKILGWCIEEYHLGTATEYREPDSRKPMLCFEGTFMPFPLSTTMA